MLALIDGFEDLLSWTSAVPGNIIHPISGRTTQCVRLMAGAGSEPTLTFMLPTPVSTQVCIGMALRSPDLTVPFLRLIGDGGIVHTWIETRVGGAIAVMHGSGSTVGVSLGNVRRANIWDFIEVASTLGSAGTGSCVVRINGVTVLTLSGANTRNGGAGAGYDRVMLYAGADTGGQIDLDDLYVLTAVGSAALWGDITVAMIRPSGTGATSTWLGTDGDNVNNYALVRNLDPAVWVQADTTGKQDLYALDDIVTPNVVKGVCHTALLQHIGPDVGTRSVKLLLRSGTTIYPETAAGIDGTLRTYTQLRDTNPNGNVAWTQTSVNALQSGVEIV